MTNSVLIESVPNFSGPPAPMTAAIAAAIATNGRAAMLDHSFDPDHNRSVITIAGPPDAVLEAALAAAAAARDSIDLRRHHGVHPRIGALDVLPFVPLEGASMADCVRLAGRAAERLWRELGIPAYLYESAARRPECRNLSDVRRLAGSIPPDVGGPAHHLTAGATAVGARPFLIAFNVNLAADDVEAARTIAAAVRESSGGLPRVKALGLRLASRGIAQVSMNLTDFTVTPVATAYDRIAAEAADLGVEILESELIGLAPRAAIDEAVALHCRIARWDATRILENRIPPAASATHL
ncbi:MAG: glutamate formimidoyltransferase [Bryobacteraceae bacterium]